MSGFAHNLKSRWQFVSRSGLLAFFMTVAVLVGAPARAIAQTFTATYTALSKTSYAPGEKVSFKLSVRSSTVAAKYSIKHVITDPSGVTKDLGLRTGVTLSNTAGTAFAIDYVIPVGSKTGSYKHTFVVMNSNWTWLTTNSSVQSFSVATKPTTLSATYGALSQGGFFKVGQSIVFRPSLKANVANNGTFIIQHRIVNSSGATVATINTNYDLKVPSATIAVALPSVTYKIPAGAGNGAYKYKLAAFDTSWKTVALANSEQIFSIFSDSAAPAATPKPGSVPTFTLTNAGPQRTTFNRGEVVTFADSLKSNLSTAANYTVIARIQDSQGLVLKDITLANTSLSSTAKKVGFSYTLPASMEIGVHTVKYFVKSADGSKSYAVTESNPKLSTFFVEIYRTDLSKVTLPTTLKLLKARVAGSNPLNGSGYIPDTGDAYTMIFNDEFNGTKLDTTKWWTRYVSNNGMDDHLNDECQNYTEKNNHPVADGVLKLTARHRPGVKCPNKYNDPRHEKYYSGMIRSKVIMKYGYFEARVKLPNGTGIWPAFWMAAENKGWPPEIDIMEYVVNALTEFPNMLHTGVVQRAGQTAQGKTRLYVDPNYNTQYSFVRAPSSLKTTYLNEDYHIISGFWNDDDTYTTFLDGNPIIHYKYKWVHENGNDAGFAHVLLNLAMGGNWGTHDWKSQMTTTPQEFKIDYVRVYQKSTKIKTGKSVTGKDLCPATGC